MFSFSSTSNIFKGYFNFVFIVTTSTAFAEVHHTTTTAALIVHHHEPQANNQQHGQYAAKNSSPPRGLGRKFCFNINIFRLQFGNQICIIIRYNGGKFFTIAQFATDDVIYNGNLLNFILINLLQEFSITKIRLLCRSSGIIIKHTNYDHNHQQIKDYVLKKLCQDRILLLLCIY